MALQYIKSQKGRDQLLHKGYLHKKERVSGDKIFWKCADYHKYHCPGRAHTCEDRVVKYSPHLHPPSKTVVEAKRVINGTKETALASQKPSAQQGITANREALPGASANKKPRIQNNPKQTIQRLRECLNAARPGSSSSHLQTSLAAAPVVTENIALSPPRDLPEASEGLAEGILKGGSGPGNAGNGSRSAPNRASQEAALQKFRSGSVVPGETAQEILSRLAEAAGQWLNPQERSKAQIVDLVVLEQFLKVLPGELQAWVRARAPGSCQEAVEWAEAYAGDRGPAGSVQDPVSFEDVSVRFTAEEWPMLSPEEKRLYWNVLHQNYDNVAWLAGDGRGSRNKQEDPWLEVSELVTEVSGKNEDSISQSSEGYSIRENCLARKPNSSIGMDKEVSVLGGKGQTKPTKPSVHLESELGLENQHIGVGAELTTHVNSQKCSTEEDAEPVVLPEHLSELPEMKRTQNPEQNLVREDQSNIEEPQSNHSAQEDNKVILSINSLWDPVLHATKSVQDSHYKSTDASDSDDTVILVSIGKIHSGGNLDSIASSEGHSLDISSKGVSQNPEPDYIHLCSELCPSELSGIADLEHSPLLDYSHVRPTEISEVYSQVSGCKITALVSKDQNVLGEQLANNSGNENQQEIAILSGNSLQGPSNDNLPLDAQPGAEAQSVCFCGGDQTETPHCSAGQTTSHEEELPKSPRCRRVLSQSSQSVSQQNCDSVKNFRSAPFLRQKKYDRRKYFTSRNISVRSVLRARWRSHHSWRPLKRLDWEDQRCYQGTGCRLHKPGKNQKELSKWDALKLTAQPPEMLHLTETVGMSSGDESSLLNQEGHKPQSSSSPLPLDSMTAEPTLAQFMSVLQQVATDTVEIKSAISGLCATLTGIQNALGSLSGCSDEAEHRISSLEDTSRNTKAQLVQHCSDIKAIEAKLIGKSVQTNVIAGLWSSLKVRRGASPPNLSPNS